MNNWTPVLLVHAVAASLGLLIGAYQLARRVKGDPVHLLLGRVWVVVLLITIGTSFAIREIRNGRLSLLHVLSLVTLVSLVVTVVAIRRGDVGRHRAAARGSWLGLVGAFVGAVAVPDRRIPTFTVTEPVGAVTAAAVLVGVTVALSWVAHLLDPGRRRLVPSPITADDRPAPAAGAR